MYVRARVSDVVLRASIRPLPPPNAGYPAVSTPLDAAQVDRRIAVGAPEVRFIYTPVQITSLLRVIPSRHKLWTTTIPDQHFRKMDCGVMEYQTYLFNFDERSNPSLPAFFFGRSGPIILLMEFGPLGKTVGEGFCSKP